MYLLNFVFNNKGALVHIRGWKAKNMKYNKILLCKLKRVYYDFC